MEPSSTTIQRAGGCGLRRHAADDALDVCRLVAHRGDDQHSLVHQPSNARDPPELPAQGTCSRRAYDVAMCGICGIAGRDPRSRPSRPPGRLRAMTESILHRGPDEDGHHVEPGVALGMRRLSIIDVEGSHSARDQRDGGRAGRLQRRDLQLRASCATSSRRAATASPRTATPRPSSTSTRSWGRTSSRACAACSPSRSGTGRGGDLCLRATGWASSRCTGPRPRTASPSRRRSSR